MTQDIIFANAKVIQENDVTQGGLVLRDGLIADLFEGTAVPSGAIDCEGDFICPGMIELHTDNLERHITPRPGVNWPHRAAIVAHDRELAATGITTVFDAIRVGSIITETNKRFGKYARQMADEILQMRAAGALRISHHIHLRAEICSETLLDELAEFGEDDRVGIVSLMDHTPGQRQFRDLQKFEDYVCGKHNLDRNGFSDYIDFLYGLQERLGVAHEAGAVAAARRYGATLASHDDTTAEQVASSAAHGVTIAEFPTTIEAADACHAAGIVTIMGAPNLVRGGSHSGNVAAHDLARMDRLDILSSDYVPAGLLLGAVQLAQLWDDWPRGIATVTANAAKHVHLDDRGAIAIGKRADIIRFSMLHDMPVVRNVWADGQQVA